MKVTGISDNVISRETADLVIFTAEIHNTKLHFLCSVLLGGDGQENI